MSKRHLAYLLERTGLTEVMLRSRGEQNAPRLTVLTYHRIDDDPLGQPFDRDVVDATTSEFEWQIRTLKQYFNVIGLEELRAYMRGGALPRAPAMITFDDGYRECHDRVLPILLANGVRGVFFLATSYIAERRVFWWDRIAYVLNHTPRERIEITYPFRMILDTKENAGVALRQALNVVKRVPCVDVERFLDGLAQAAGVAWGTDLERAFASRLVMTWDQVRALHAAGMDVHSHTQTHRVLETLSDAELMKELRGARADLEREIGETSHAIAYPVGRSIGKFPRIRAAVERAGYELGFSNGSGASPLSSHFDPLDVQRISVERGLPQAYFRALIAAPWFANAKSALQAVRPPVSRPGVGIVVRRGLSCTVIHELSELARRESEWWDLLRRSETNLPMLSPLWLMRWWRVFGDVGGRRLRVAAFSHGGRLVGLAPLVARSRFYRPGIPFRRLELLGTGEPEQDEICSEYLGILAERGFEESVAASFASALHHGQLGEWDELVFDALPSEGAATAPLLRALRDEGISADQTASGACSYAELPSTWDAYLGGLPSAGRYAVRRSLRDFEAWTSGAYELRRAGTPAELAEGMRMLESLHAERWGGGGLFRSARFAAFHEKAMRELLAAGALELVWLIARGKPVAALYNIVWNEKEYFYQCGRALDVPEKLRPGIVIHALQIRRAIEAGRREYDFLAGRTQYKRQFAPQTRSLVRLRAVHAPVRELMRRASDHGFRTAGTLRRELLERDSLSVKVRTAS